MNFLDRVLRREQPGVISKLDLTPKNVDEARVMETKVREETGKKEDKSLSYYYDSIKKEINFLLTYRIPDLIKDPYATSNPAILRDFRKYFSILKSQIFHSEVPQAIPSIFDAMEWRSNNGTGLSILDRNEALKKTQELEAIFTELGTIVDLDRSFDPEKQNKLIKVQDQLQHLVNNLNTNIPDAN